MSEKNAQFVNKGAVLTAVLSLLFAVITWVSAQATQVPVIIEKIDHMNNTARAIKNDMKEIHLFIKQHDQDRAEWMAWRMGVLIRLDTAESEIKECMAHKVVCKSHIEHERERGQY